MGKRFPLPGETLSHYRGKRFPITGGNAFPLSGEMLSHYRGKHFHLEEEKKYSLNPNNALEFRREN
ncbi:hypothetical protein ACT29H_07460 [Thermophagus sp. OGC60D27]|uniref:hypothetical protein n=1 Tax=Thermophagus sp. OGC60D27 TaxID=3458415 RepID=UPI004037688F